MVKLTLGKYHYWDETEDDNVKRFHFMVGSDGIDYHIDFSPYHHPSKEEIEAVREIVEITGIIPHRGWNLGTNFRKEILTLLEEVKEGPFGNLEREYGE